ncbi:MAG TPA: transposase [Candidatus Limnocylindrales bacterium]
MPVTVPPSLLIVLEVLRPCFTAPSFATMSALVTGALSASGPRTVTGLWQAAGLAGCSHWSRAHRFFSRAVWDLDQAGLALARAVVERFVPDGAAVTVAVDDTLFHRYGKKVRRARYQHDGSAENTTRLPMVR